MLGAELASLYRLQVPIWSVRFDANFSYWRVCYRLLNVEKGVVLIDCVSLYADIFNNPIHRGWAVAWYLVGMASHTILTFKTPHTDLSTVASLSVGVSAANPPEYHNLLKLNSLSLEVVCLASVGSGRFGSASYSQQFVWCHCFLYPKHLDLSYWQERQSKHGKRTPNRQCTHRWN